MTHGGIEQRGLILGSKSVLQESDNFRPFLTKFHQNLAEKIIPVEQNHQVGIGLVEIHTLPTDHTDPMAVGFKFFCPKLTLSYTGDTAYSEQLIGELAGTDVLILNVPYPGNKAEGKNLDTESAIRMISKVQPKLAIITHFGLEMIKADPMFEAREIQRLTGIQTIAAQDGLAITPGSYGNPVKGYS